MYSTTHGRRSTDLHGCYVSLLLVVSIICFRESGLCESFLSKGWVLAAVSPQSCDGNVLTDVPRYPTGRGCMKSTNLMRKSIWMRRSRLPSQNALQKHSDNRDRKERYFPIRLEKDVGDKEYLAKNGPCLNDTIDNSTKKHSVP